MPGAFEAEIILSRLDDVPSSFMEEKQVKRFCLYLRMIAILEFRTPLNDQLRHTGKGLELLLEHRREQLLESFVIHRDIDEPVVSEHRVHELHECRVERRAMVVGLLEHLKDSRFELRIVEAF